MDGGATTGRAVAKRGKPTPKGSGGRKVYEAIRRRILSLELAPGQDLEEAELVRAFGFSRTPVREALIRLASEHLVVLLPNRGARVAPMSLDSVREFFEALSLAQRAVSRWAAARGAARGLASVERHAAAFEAAAAARDVDRMAESNRDMHAAVAHCAGNRYLARTYLELLDEGMRLSHLSVGFDPPTTHDQGQHLDGIVADHRALIAALAAGDSDRAERLAAEHVDRFRDRITRYLAEDEGGAVTIEPPPSRPGDHSLPKDRSGSTMTIEGKAVISATATTSRKKKGSAAAPT